MTNMYDWQKEVTASKSLTDSARRVGMALMTYSKPDGSSCFPRHWVITFQFNIPERQVRRGIFNLRAAGLLCPGNRPYQFLIEGEEVTGDLKADATDLSVGQHRPAKRTLQTSPYNRPVTDQGTGLDRPASGRALALSPRERMSAWMDDYTAEHETKEDGQ